MKGLPGLAGISWTDVEEWIVDFEKEARAHCEFSTCLAGKGPGALYGLTVKLTVTGVEHGGSRGYTRVYRASWPTYGHKTMPGLFLYLLHAATEDHHYRPPTAKKPVMRPSYPVD